MRALTLHIAPATVMALISAAGFVSLACGGTETSAADLNSNAPPMASASAPPAAVGAMDAQNGTSTQVAAANAPDPANMPNMASSGPAGATDPSGAVDTPGTNPSNPALDMPGAGTTPADNTDPIDTMGGTEPAVDDTPVTPEPAVDDPTGAIDPGENMMEPTVMAGAGGAAAMPGEDPMMEPEVVVEEGPYAPRTGSFKVLVYSKTGGFRHPSIPAGKDMLSEIAQEQGFEVKFTETNEDITVEGLSQYEMVFFMNSTGDIFNNTEQQAYEEWMTTMDGAFAGVHSATDTENGWAFYSEVTGQYYDLHDTCCAEADIQWDPDALDFIAVQGLPNPWRRAEEWYKFNRATEWETKTGFKILSRVTTNNLTRPVSFIREWNNFRSFYTSLGHEDRAFQDDSVKKHVAAGIMWAVRREAELKQ